MTEEDVSDEEIDRRVEWESWSREIQILSRGGRPFRLLNRLHISYSERNGCDWRYGKD